MKRRPLLVEFIGLPAGGKTTLATALASELLTLDGQSYITSTRDARRLQGERELSPRRLIGFMWFAVTRLGLLCSVMAYVVAANPGRVGLLRGAVLFRAFHTIEQLTKHCPDCVIMEEGFLQMAWSVTVHRWCLPTKQLARLIRRVTDKYHLVVVWVRISPQTAMERFLRRGLGGRLAVLSNEELLAVFEKGANEFEEIVAFCNDGAVTVICVDGMAGVDRSIQAIQQTIAERSAGVPRLDRLSAMNHAENKS